jgi:hypothetical protein
MLGPSNAESMLVPHRQHFLALSGTNCVITCSTYAAIDAEIFLQDTRKAQEYCVFGLAQAFATVPPSAYTTRGIQLWRQKNTM